jgi:dephospho-CoA kinase
MIKLGLTGSIGMGKSTVAHMFEAAGIPLFDADAVVRTLQAQDRQLIDDIKARFPDTVLNGTLNREALADQVLGHPGNLRILESLVHPAVRSARARFIAENGEAAALLFDIPLLFETGAEEEFDKVIVVSAPPEVQRARVLARPGMTEARLESILARQLPDAQKRNRADFVIDTGGNLSTTEAQVRQILSCLGLPSRR